MRRLNRLALILVFVLAWDWCPITPPIPLGVHAAGAQIPGPGNQLAGTGVSATVTNTTANFYSTSIPAGLTNGPNMVHVKVLGSLTTAASPGSYTLTAAYGYTAAAPLTLTIANALPLSPSLTNAPLQIDVWLAGADASRFGGNPQTNNQIMHGQFMAPNTGQIAGSCAICAYARTTSGGGGVDMTANQTLTLQWFFGIGGVNTFNAEHVNVTVE